VPNQAGAPFRPRISGVQARPPFSHLSATGLFADNQPPYIGVSSTPTCDSHARNSQCHSLHSISMFGWSSRSCSFLACGIHVVNTRNQVVAHDRRASLSDYRAGAQTDSNSCENTAQLGGIDISPIILFLIIVFIRSGDSVLYLSLCVLSLPNAAMDRSAAGSAVNVRLTRRGRNKIDGIERPRMAGPC